jgi:hypothetical protein
MAVSMRSGGLPERLATAALRLEQKAPGRISLDLAAIGVGMGLSAGAGFAIFQP